MKYYLKANEALPKGIDRIARRLLDRSYKLLTDNEETPDIAVHEVRKHSKKLRALLQLLSPGMTRKAYRQNDHALRDFARQLNGTRDSATLLASLNHVRQHFKPFLDDSATAPVCEELVRRHETAMRQHQESIDIAGVEDQLQHIATRLGELDQFDFSLDTLLASLETSYNKGRRSLQALRKSAATKRRNEFRKQVKTLWYQLRLMSQWNPELLSPLIRQLGELRELLGKDNDLAELIDILPAIESARENPARIELLVSLAESRRCDLLEQALRLGDELYSRKTDEFMDWFKAIKLEH